VIALAGTLGLANCGPSQSKPSPSDAGKSDAAACVSGPERNGPYTRVTVVGDTSAMGIIDPSVEYAATAATGLMTYTAVPSETQDHIAIATSDDKGASWQFVSNVTVASPITISTTDDELCGSSSCEGTFVQESSSLILDPFDPDPDRLLKVFAHTYFRTTDTEKDTPFDLGYIALYTAGSAEGPWRETPLFGWPSSSPISNASVAYDISAVGGLNDCYIVGEPGAIVRGRRATLPPISPLAVL
jgi:hypothetical protein